MLVSRSERGDVKQRAGDKGLEPGNTARSSHRNDGLGGEIGGDSHRDNQCEDAKGGFLSEIGTYGPPHRHSYRKSMQHDAHCEFVTTPESILP